MTTIYLVNPNIWVQEENDWWVDLGTSRGSLGEESRTKYMREVCVKVKVLNDKSSENRSF